MSLRAITILSLTLLAAPALAQTATVETAKLGKSQVTLTAHSFLTPEELQTLRLVMTNKQALSVFLPGKPANFSALAVSPSEGFIRGGKPVASAAAVADLPDVDTARLNALQSCDKARAKASEPCVVVLEVGPAKKK
ncbi:hypothetical protein [Fuscibacter oryzae]|uniref:5-aminolevulic acid synthase n=1 Tax=Fuscibacter oryzae TaxID=2803939 RepID=A0A8J7MQQ3_9RHOB|nr:hypothetical protein [Fuscibacter oryzae]MBL4927119.1 hypothetical protein [Fuscibacter oryzae]